MNSHPQLLEGKRILIVGGLQRLSKFYESEVRKLGARKTEWRHHKRNKLGKAQPDLLIMIASHHTGQSGDRVDGLGVDTIRVYKHQKSSFLPNLIEQLTLSEP